MCVRARSNSYFCLNLWFISYVLQGLMIVRIVNKSYESRAPNLKMDKNISSCFAKFMSENLRSFESNVTIYKISYFNVLNPGVFWYFSLKKFFYVFWKFIKLTPWLTQAFVHEDILSCSFKVCCLCLHVWGDNSKLHAPKKYFSLILPARKTHIT